MLTRTSANDTSWNAELRIPASVLGGWNHVIGLDLGHYSVRSPGDDYHWPYLAGPNQPGTWARTALGDVPRIIAISPVSATAGSAGFDLTITGDHFSNGATVRWAETDKPTSFVSSTQLQVHISAADLTKAGTLTLTVTNPNVSDVPSNSIPFTINNPQPVITALTPGAVRPGSPSFMLTVTGAHFVQGATVLWNGVPRPTTFVSSTQLQAQISGADLADQRTVGIAVLNPAPSDGASNIVAFTIGDQPIYLPLIVR